MFRLKNWFLGFFMASSVLAQAQVGTHDQNLQKLQILIDRSIAQESDSRALVDSLKNLSSRLDEELSDLEKQTSKTARAEAKNIENQLKTLEKQQKIAKKQEETAMNLRRQAKKMQGASPKDLQKFIAQIEAKEGEIALNSMPSMVGTSPENLANQVPDEPKTVEEPPKKSAKKPTKSTPKPKKDTRKVVKKDPVPPSNPDEFSENSAAQSSEIAENAPPPVSEPKSDKKNKKSDKKSDKKTDKKSDKKPAKTAATPKPTATTYAKYDPNQDPAVAPPSLPCAVVFAGRDTFSGKSRLELASFKLFSHTDDFLRATMKDKDFIVCDAQLSRAEGYRYLNLTYTIASREAQRNFGILDKSSPISFKLMNGRNVNLLNTKTDLGIVDPEKGTTTYRATYLVSDGDARELQNAELDVLRVAWSTGYEDYEIFAVDIIQQQLKCLEK